MSNMMNVPSAVVGFPPQDPSGQYTQTESARGRLGDPRQYEYPPLDVPFTNQSAYSSQFTPQGFCYDSPFVYSDPPPMNHHNREQQPQADQVRPAPAFYSAQQDLFTASTGQHAPTVDIASGLAPHLAQPRAGSTVPTPNQNYGLTWLDPTPLQDVYRKEEKPNEIPFVYPATTLQTGDRFSQLLEAKLGLNSAASAGESHYSPPLRATFNSPSVHQPAQSSSFPANISQANIQSVGIPGPAYHNTLAIETALHDYQQVTISPDDVAPVVPSRYFGWDSRSQPEYQHTPQSFSPTYEAQPMQPAQHYDASQNGHPSSAANNRMPSAPAGSIASGSIPGTPQLSPLAGLATPIPAATKSPTSRAAMLHSTFEQTMKPPPYWYPGSSSSVGPRTAPAPAIPASSQQLHARPPISVQRTTPPLAGSRSRLSALSPMTACQINTTPASAPMDDFSMLNPTHNLESTPMMVSASLPALPSLTAWSQDSLSMPPPSSTAWTSSPPKARSSASPPNSLRIPATKPPSQFAPSVADGKKRKAVDDEVTTNELAKPATESACGGDGERKQVIACYHCREKKLKCDGGKPRCGNCCRRGEVSCAYDVKLKRRGPGKNNKKDRRRRAAANGGTRQDQSGLDPSSSVAPQGLDTESSRLGSRFETSTARGQ